jgi:pilus assembly protein CpaC
MHRNSNGERAALGLLVTLLIGCFAIQGQAFAAKTPDVVVDMDAGQSINLVVGKLGKLKSSKPVKRAHMVQPEIAELIVTNSQSPHWVFFSAKAAGTTQLTLWDEDNRILGIFNIVVTPDVAELKKKLYEIFPDENVQVRSSGNYITLDGTVTDTSRMTKIVALAETYAPEPGKVLNMLKIGGIQQVMLEVKVAEISRNVGKQLGINFAAISDDGNNIGVSMIGNLVSTELADGLLTTTIGSSVNGILGFFGNGDLLVFMNALEEDGLIKILAEPTLIALSGQNASFLAGGEFPVPSGAGLGTTDIEWKEFGVSLNFTPTVLGDGNLSMRVNPEISELDFSNATLQNGFLIPGLETRRMSTVVEMKDGQSFAIAGLLKSVVRENISRFPILGSIPIIGALFRSTDYQKNETELVVIVTPHLVKPLDMANQPLPTDSFIDPSTFELLLLGMLEGQPPAPMQETIGLEGDFGYIIPE